MYEKFYGLKESPFNLTPDSRFLFLSHHHREAMAAMLYGIRERKGFVLLTGEIGSGKTTLCRGLVNELEGSGTQIALILNTSLDEHELLQAINEELGIDASASTRKGLIDALHTFLVDQYELGHNVVVVVDEAQNLSDALLEQVRLLGNLETEQHKLLQILLVGQPELQATLQSPKLEQLNQRIAVRYHLRALLLDEIEPYVHHRLRVAGLAVPIEFTLKAFDLIHDLTGGVPRKINLLLDRALLASYVASTYTIDDAIIHTAAIEVGADQWSGTTQAAGVDGAPADPGRRLFSSGLLYALTLFVILAMVPVLLSESGLWGRWFPSQPGDGPGGNDPTSTTATIQVLPPAPTPQPTRTTATPTPAVVVTPDPTTFRLARPNLADPWTYDDDWIVRVAQPEFCKTAAILTLLAAWGIEVNLQDFRQLAPVDVERLDLIEANRDLGLRAVDVKGGLRRVEAYDLPVVVEVADPEKRLSPFVVLVGVTPTMCRVADPMMGVQNVPRRLFESFWRSALGVYFDSDSFDTLVRGRKSEGARELQQALADLEFYRGPLTGEIDRSTVAAIEYLQRFYDLHPTGRLSPLTVMLITSHRQADRPRLTEKSDEKGEK